MKYKVFPRLLVLVSAVLLFSALVLTVHNRQAAGTTSTIREVDSDGSVGVGTAVAVNNLGEVVIAYFDATNLALKVAVCENKNCYNPDIETVDNSGDVGVSPAIAIRQDDRPVISYFDIANGNLKLAVCDDTICTGANIQVVDDTANVGLTSSIVLDDAGRPIISYYDVTNQQLKLAYCNNPACTAPSLEVVDSAGNPGLFSSLILDDDGLVVVAYHEADNEDLKIAFCNDASCSVPSIKSLDAVDNAGRYASLEMISGRIFVSYLRSNGVTDDIKVARCDDFACSIVSVLHVIEMQAAQYSSMVMNNQGELFISFLDAAQGDLIVAACIVDPAIGCEGATFTRVDRFHFTGLHTAITLDHEGTPIISYHDQEEEALNLASCALCRVPARNNIGPVAAQDSISLAVTDVGYPIMTYQDAGDNNFYLVFCQDTICENFEKSSIGTNLHINPSIALQENGRPAITYYHAATNELKYTLCNNDDCTDQTTNVIAFDGYDPTLLFDSQGLPVISYYDAFENDLHVAYCNEITCSAPGKVLIDDVGDVGQKTSMVLTPEDYPIVSYYDATNDTIKFVMCQDTTCGTTIFKNAQVTDGPYSAVALSESGRLYIAFYNNGAQILSTLECNLPCNSTGIGTLDNTAVDVGWDISIAISEDDLPIISYYDVENSALRLATCIYYACSLGATLSVIDNLDGETGRFSQMVLNGRGQPVIAHANLTSPSARIVVYDTEPILYHVYAPVLVGQ